MSTEKYIYFVRHCESEANDKFIFQPADDPVTERGRQQCEHLANRFRTITFDTLLTSPFERAKVTAEYIAKATGVTLVESADWREYVPPKSVLGLERNSNEGETYMQARRAHITDPTWHYEDEENYYDLHNRATVALKGLMEHSGKHIVVVTHLGFLKAVVTNMLTRGEPDADLYVKIRFLLESKNTGITTCRYGTDKQGRPGWRVLTWNDFTHLPRELATLSDPLGAM